MSLQIKSDRNCFKSNVLDKEEGPNLGNFALYSIILLDFYAHFVIAKIILFEVGTVSHTAYIVPFSKWNFS